MAPKISVVMPTYNREGMICHAIQSILDQTFNDWELIIVDDGSTDKTESVVKMFGDKRIRYFKNPKNRGIGYSRNFGNKKANADIIVVQDSDDMSFPDRLEEIYKVFQSFDTDILYHWFYIRAIDIRYGARAVHREIQRCGEYDKKKAVQIPYIPGQVAYKRSKILKYPYREEMRCWDDWMMIIDFTMHNCKFLQLKKPLYEYVISDDSVTMRSDNTGLREEEAGRMKKILKKEYKLKIND